MQRRKIAMITKRTENGIYVTSGRILRDARAARANYLASLLRSFIRCLRPVSKLGTEPLPARG
jgi:hypothetical protein